MAGGTWARENKSRPGVYIRFKSNGSMALNVGSRGTVAICEAMSWGPVGQVMEVPAGEDTTPYCGYAITEPEARFLREIFKGTNRTTGPNKVLLYRPSANGAVAAAASMGDGLTATAVYPGAVGNSITVSVAAVPDEPAAFTVSTIVGGEILDSQTVTEVSALKENAWVKFSGEGALVANTGVSLTGGADGTVQNAAYSAFLEALEPYTFDILLYDGTDSTVQTAMQNFIIRLAEESGQYAQLVTSNMAKPDSRFVINVMSGASLSDGTELTPAQMCWWAGGAQAGAGYSESLTYTTYPGAVTVSPKLTNSQYEQAIANGQFVLFEDNGAVKVEQDINSLVTYTPDIGRAFRKNRVVRLCSTIANDLFRQFSENYIGLVNNNEAGRTMFKSSIVNYLLQLQGEEAIQNFSADDVEVLPGSDTDAVLVNIAIQAVDSIEKIYMTIEVS